MDSSDPPEYAVRQTELGMLPMGAKVGRVQPGKCEQVFVVWDSPVSWAGTVSHNPRHANSTMRFHALQRIKQRRRPDQFEHFVHALTTSLCLNLGSDIPVLDHHAADAAVF